jgi:hypothetical protein
MNDGGTLELFGAGTQVDVSSQTFSDTSDTSDGASGASSVGAGRSCPRRCRRRARTRWPDA